MATKVNEILQFASQDTGSNLLTQSEYDGDAQRVIGHQPGIARSRLENKVLRQCSTMSAGLAEFMLRNQDGSITDGMTPQEVADALTTAIGGAGGTRMNRVNASIINNTTQGKTRIDIPNNLVSLVDVVGDSFTITIGLIRFRALATTNIVANKSVSNFFDVNIEGKTPLAALMPCGVIVGHPSTVFEWKGAECGSYPNFGGTFGCNVYGQLLVAKNADEIVFTGTIAVFYAP